MKPNVALNSAIGLTLGLILSGCVIEHDGLLAPDKPDAGQATAMSTSSSVWSYESQNCDEVAFLPMQAWMNGWCLDTSVPKDAQGNFRLRRLQFTGTLLSNSFSDVEAVSASEVWALKQDGSVYRNVTADAANYGTWSRIYIPIPGIARRIACGYHGETWVLSTETVAGGYRLYRYTGTPTDPYSWTLVDGGLVEMDVDNNGDLWGINNQNYVFRLPGGRIQNGWQLMPYAGSDGAQAKFIAVGNGNVFLRTDHWLNHGYSLKQWNGTGWSPISGELVKITADGVGHLWGSNQDFQVFQYYP
jgi:hypothetical protein